MCLYNCVCVFISVHVQTQLQAEISRAYSVELEGELQQLKVTNMGQSRIAAEAAGTTVVHGLFLSDILISNTPTIGLFSSNTNSYLLYWG